MTSNLVSKEFKEIMEQIRAGEETSDKYLVFKKTKPKAKKYISPGQIKAIRNGK